MLVNVPISVGELIDKITILEIKQERFNDENKLINVNKEIKLLRDIKETLDIPASVEIFTMMLRDTNRRLWEIEDGKRACEANNEFGDEFIKLSRELYINNDLRGMIKRKINDLVGSEIIEEKDYVKYKVNHEESIR